MKWVIILHGVVVLFAITGLSLTANYMHENATVKSYPPPTGSGFWGMSAPTGGTISIEENTDRPGMNYNSYVLPSADHQICANDCANDTRCWAFTYVEPGFPGPNSPPECWLKNPVPDPVSQEGCISGIKSPTPPSGSVPLDQGGYPSNNYPGDVLLDANA